MKNKIASHVLWIEAPPFCRSSIKDEIFCMKKAKLFPSKPILATSALHLVFFIRYKGAHMDIMVKNALDALEGTLFDSKKLIRVHAKLRRLPGKKHADEKVAVGEGILVMIEYLKKGKS